MEEVLPSPPYAGRQAPIQREDNVGPANFLLQLCHQECEGGSKFGRCTLQESLTKIEGGGDGLLAVEAPPSALALGDQETDSDGDCRFDVARKYMPAAAKPKPAPKHALRPPLLALPAVGPVMALPPAAPALLPLPDACVSDGSSSSSSSSSNSPASFDVAIGRSKMGK